MRRRGTGHEWLPQMRLPRRLAGYVVGVLHEVSPSTTGAAAWSPARRSGARVDGARLQGDTAGLFDEPSRWRAEAARALGLDGESLLAGVSPGASCPSVLYSMANAILDGRDHLGLVVDLGAGVGGISEWFRRRTHAAVVAVEPAPGARDAAMSLFPSLTVRPGTAEASGLPGAIADAVLLSGVVSLIDDLDPVLAEAVRVARADGAVAIGDLFSSGPQTLHSARNVFRSVESVAERLGALGWSVVEVGIGSPPPDASWAVAAEAIDDWIRRHRGDHPAFEVWADDHAHLGRHIERGDLVAACLIARTSPRRVRRTGR